jgi:DNA-binding CsgD family transcriptional regulator
VRGRPIALIGALRSGERSDAATVIDELCGREELALRVPAPLSQTAVLQLAGAALGGRATPELAQACVEATGGNPLLVRGLLDEIGAADDQLELIARVREVSPDSVREETARRLAREADDVQRVAVAAAVLGGGTRIDEVAMLSGVSDSEAADAADRLVALEILDPGAELAFVHPLIEAAVLGTLPEHRRRANHARAARVLDRAGAAPERVAAQIVAAAPGHDAWSVEVLAKAAAAALARGAPDSAVIYLERALAEPPDEARRSELLHLLGRAVLGSRPDAAVEHLTAALGSTSTLPVRVRIALDLAFALVHTDAFDRADAVLGRIATELGERERELSLCVAAVRIGVSQQSVALREQGLARMRDLADEVAAGSTPGERLVLAQVAAASPIGNETAEIAAQRARRALGGGKLLAELTSDAPTIWYAGSGLLFAEKFDECERFAEDALADARRRGSRLGMSLALWFRGAVAQRSGRLDAAVEDGRASLEVSPGSGPAIFFALQVVCDSEIARGRADAGLALTDRFLPAGPTEATFSNAIALHTRGMLRLAIGEPTAAAADVEASARLFGALDYGPWVLPWRSDTATVLAAIGRSAEAATLAASELELARRWGAPRALGIALRAAGLLSRPVDLGLLEQAVDVLSASPDRTAHGRALLDLGAALRRAGRRAAAIERLRAALAASVAAGAAGVGAEIRAELAAAGAASLRAVHRDQELTARELRVAELAAQRLTNREIADALFIAVRTVETHLTHVYAKLGVRGRRELAAALGSLAVSSPSPPSAQSPPSGQSPPSVSAAPGAERSGRSQRQA